MQVSQLFGEADASSTYGADFETSETVLFSACLSVKDLSDNSDGQTADFRM